MQRTVVTRRRLNLLIIQKLLASPHNDRLIVTVLKRWKELTLHQRLRRIVHISLLVDFRQLDLMIGRKVSLSPVYLGWFPGVLL